MADVGLRQLLPTLIVIIVGLLGPRSLWGTVLVPMSDADLVFTSSFVLTGEVLEIESVELDGGRIVTRITLGVDQMLKGRIAGDTIVITEPGGRVGDRAVHIFGAPEYVRGERVLVFLWRAGDGTLRTNGLALGKYTIEGRRRGSQRALRAVPVPDVRDLDDFVATLNMLTGSQPPDTDVPSGTGAPDGQIGEPLVVERYTLLGQPPSRWYEPDRRKSVVFLLANSDATLGVKETEDVVGEALAAWTDVRSASVVLENAGGASPTPSVAGGVCDQESRIQFGDPFDEMPALRRCTGVFAVGGFCPGKATRKVGGTTFSRINEGDVTVNQDVGACVGRVNMVETVAHEFGHTIGLGHSSDPEALMYEFAHHDGRGAALHSDDINGVSAVYPVFDSDGDGVRDARDRCPSTPDGLVIDSDGCACTEPGSAGCDDGDACTEDGCNTMTGACINAPVDCDDGLPCTHDCCNASTGACINDLKGDSDGDGLCDPIDGCPLQPHADPTDLNGDGVGDVCQCADENPGRCVPGRGSKANRCLIEWLPVVTPRVDGAGFPSARLRCIDGDPECDDDVVPGQCTFRVALCVDNDDPRLRKCKPSTVERLLIRSPKLDRLKDAADTANAEVLGAAIEAIVPGDPGASPCGRVPTIRCGSMLPIVVPTGSLRSGSRRLNVVGETDKGRRARAKLKLICEPAGQ